METTRRLHPLLTAAAISLIVFSAVGVATLTGALPLSRGSNEKTVSMPAPARTTAAPAAKPKPRPVARAVAPRPPAPAPVPVAAAEPVKPAPPPGAMGVIASVKEIEQSGDAKGIGAVSGGVAGAVIGHNVGEHNKLVTLLGAVGGALLDNHIEKQARATRRWETTVRMDDGSTRTVSSDGEPAWRAGERVRVLDGKILES